MKRLVVFLLVAVIVIMPFEARAITVSAKAAVVINGDNAEVIFAKNADARLSMASTTKIMTALLLCEYGNFQKEIIVTEKMLRVEGSSMGLLPGDRVTLGDLLYGLMLASGNDAANVIAYAVAGSLEGFVNLMNDKAKQLKLTSTRFETPSGLDGENHYTTAYELALLTRYAMQNEEFCKAVAAKKATLCYGNPPYKRTLTNHNKMLNLYEDAVGVKTGFTKKSGRCLVSAAKREGRFVIAVTLNAPRDWQDHIAMLDYGLSAIKQTRISPKSNNYSLPIISGKSNSFSVQIEPLVINSLNTDDISCEVYLPSFIYAPIKKGDVIGNVVYYKGENEIAAKPIFAKCDVLLVQPKQSTVAIILRNFKHILKNI